jgi:hypothetical protein
MCLCSGISRLNTIMRFNEFNEQINKADAEAHSERMKQAKNKIKHDEGGRSHAADEWLRSQSYDEIVSMKWRQPMEAELERLEKWKVEQLLRKQHGAKGATTVLINAVYNRMKDNVRRQFLKHRKKR